MAEILKSVIVAPDYKANPQLKVPGLLLQTDFSEKILDEYEGL